MLAAEYKTACRELLELHNTLKGVREEIERMEKRDGYYYSSFPTIFTAGLNADRLMISKADCAWLTGIAFTAQVPQDIRGHHMTVTIQRKGSVDASL